MLAVALPRSRVLLPTQLQHLSEHRYVVIKDWLSVAQVAELQKDATAVDEYGSTRDSHIGNGQIGSATLDPSIRKSRQCSLVPPPSNAAGSTHTRARLIHVVNGLRQELQASTTLGLPHLEPFQTELSYVIYPVGGHYKRHLDTKYASSGWKLQGRKACDGGSFCGGRTRRVISFILYLNSGWDDANGGELRVFPAFERDPGTRNGQCERFTEDIVPEGGTLVLLMSTDVEHLVRVTRAKRQCVVGWFREYREERVPDLDQMSLRTLL